MTPEEEIRKAGKANEILENELFKEAFSEIEGAILGGIRRAAFKDSDLREKLCQQYVILHSIRDQLKTYMESGVLANEELRQRSMAEKMKSAWETFTS